MPKLLERIQVVPLQKGLELIPAFDRDPGRRSTVPLEIRCHDVVQRRQITPVYGIDHPIYEPLVLFACCLIHLSSFPEFWLIVECPSFLKIKTNCSTAVSGKKSGGPISGPDG